MTDHLPQDQQDMLRQMQEDMHTPLHPDLLPWVEEGGPLGKALRHPLVYDIGLVMPGRANRQYEWEKERRQQYFDDGDWPQFIMVHERPYRLDAFLEIEDGLDDVAWWELLADVWIDSENIWQNQETWNDLWTSGRSQRERVMDEDDRVELAAMPERIRVYRGAIREANEDGLSWTTDAERAGWFARRFKREGQDAVAIHGEVDKGDVLAYFSGRGESEIVLPLDCPSLKWLMVEEQ